MPCAWRPLRLEAAASANLRDDRSAAVRRVDFLQALPIFERMSQLATLPIARRWIKHVLARAVVAAL
jgi:hypothetical protein